MWNLPDASEKIMRRRGEPMCPPVANFLSENPAGVFCQFQKPAPIGAGFCRYAAWAAALPKKLFGELFKFVEYELHLGSDDDLYGGLTRTNDAGGAGGFDFLFVNQQTILNFQTQSGDTVIDAGEIFFAAYAFHNDLCHGGVVIVGQLDFQFAFLIVLTAGGLEVPLLNGEQEYQVEDNESGNAQRDDEPGLCGSGEAGGEDQVGSAGRETEAGAEAQGNGDGGEDAVQQSVNDVQGECQEHERKFKRFGNAADERADSGGAYQTDGGLALCGFCSLDHCDGGAGDTKHHAGEEAGHVHTHGPVNDSAVGHGAAFCERAPVSGEVAETDGVKPEYIVQSVMQTSGNQQTVQERVDTCANSAQALDAVAHSNQRTENDGPYEQQNGGSNDGNHSRYNGDGAFAAEEGQHIGELGALELIVAKRTDETSQNANEGIRDFGESNFICLVGDHARRNGADHGNAEQVCNHQPGDETGQTGGTVVFVGKANGHAHREQDGHVVNDSAAGFDQEEAQDIPEAAGGSVRNAHNAGSNGVAQTHQNAADGEAGHGQH